MAASANRHDQRFTITKNSRHVLPSSGKKEKERGASVPGKPTNPKSNALTILTRITSKD